jgi:hypothetical protein
MGLKLAGWTVLLALLIGCGFLALFVAPERAPEPGVETTNWLAAASLAVDGDLLFASADADRFRQRFGVAPREVRSSGGDSVLEAPPLAARAWAAAARVSPRRGPYVLQWFLFAATLLLVCWIFAPSLGDAAPLWIALFAFGSVTFRSVFQLLPELSVLAGVVLAAALVWGRPRPAVAPAAQVYESERPEGDRLVRWLLAGLALGAAAVRSPLYLLVALPMAVDLPRARRAPVGAVFALGLALPIAFVAAVAGLPWPAPSPNFSPVLFGWNLLFAFVGGSAGILLWFVPVVPLLLLARRRGAGRDGRAWLPVAVLTALIVQLLLSPFDWAGERISAGSAWFLPLFGALWFALDPGAAGHRRAFAAAAGLVLLAGASFLLPFWRHPTVPAPAVPAMLATPIRAVRGLPPFETTLREIPGAVEIRRGGARLRSIDRALVRDGDRLLWSDARRVTAMLESDRPLGSVTLELGEGAPSDVELGGGASGSTTFRPGGEVAIEILLSRPERRHPLWWSAAPASIYRIQLAVPEAPRQPISIDLLAARPAAPGPADEAR